jgi:hypothetical protein
MAYGDPTSRRDCSDPVLVRRIVREVRAMTLDSYPRGGEKSGKRCPRLRSVK